MPTLSPNLDLTLYDRVSDTGSTFVDFRDELAGTGNSNMVKIDNAVQDVLNALDSAKGVGYTNQTIKGNYDDNQTNKQRIVYPANASGTNTLTASIAELTSVQNNLPIILIPSAKNTGAVTLNINTFGALPVNKTRNVSGSTVYTSLESGDLQPNMPILIIKDLTGTRYLASNFGEDFARNSFYDFGNGTFSSVQSMLDAVNVASRSSVVDSYSPVTSLTTGTKNGLIRGTLSGMTLNNAVVNGDFSGGTTGWAGSSSTLSASNKILTATGTGTSVYVSALQTLATVRSASKYFFMARAMVTNSVCQAIHCRLVFGGGTSITLGQVSSPAINTRVEVKGILTATDQTGAIQMYLRSQYADNAAALNKVMEIDGNSGVFAIDMTALGLDALTADQMKDLCDNGYFEGLKGSDVEVQTVGKNLFNKNTIRFGAYNSTTGIFATDSANYATQKIKIKPSSNYKLSGNTGTYRYLFFDSSENLISTATNSVEFQTSPSNAKYVAYQAAYAVFNLNALQLELGTTATAYSPYSQSTLSLDKVLNRVPAIADTYALDTGTFTQNVQEYTLVSSDVTGLNTASYTNLDMVTCKVFSDAKVVTGTYPINNSFATGFIYRQNATLDNVQNQWTQELFTDQRLYFYVPKGTYTTLAQAQTALAGTKILYQLATPVTTVYNKDLLSFENGTLYDNGLLPTYKQITTPLNLASTIADQSTINEHLEYRLNRVDGVWYDYVPTLTFTGTPPSAITTIARYTTIGKVCHFNIYLSSSDGNGATALKISTAVTPKDNNSVLALNAQEKVNTTWSNPLAYIDDDDGNGIQFRAFSTATDAVAWELIVTGSYEVSV